MSAPPVLPPGITAAFVPARGGDTAGAIRYSPALYVAASVRVEDRKRRIAETLPVQVIVPVQSGASPLAFDRAIPVDVPPADLEQAPRGAAAYDELPTAATTPRNYDKWRKDVATWLYDTQAVTLQEHVATGLHSHPGESDGAFHARVAEAQREQRDAQIDAIRKKYAAKIASQQDRVRRAEQQLGKQREDVTSSTGSAILTAATGMFGALFGRKTFSVSNAGRLGTAARGAGKVLKEKQDVTRAEETLAAERQKLADLQTTVEAEASRIAAAETTTLQPLVLRPRKTDITVSVVTLAWVPGVSS